MLVGREQLDKENKKKFIQIGLLIAEILRNLTFQGNGCHGNQIISLGRKSEKTLKIFEQVL